MRGGAAGGSEHVAAAAVLVTVCRRTRNLRCPSSESVAEGTASGERYQPAVKCLGTAVARAPWLFLWPAALKAALRGLLPAAACQAGLLLALSRAVQRPAAGATGGIAARAAGASTRPAVWKVQTASSTRCCIQPTTCGPAGWQGAGGRGHGSRSNSTVEERCGSRLLWQRMRPRARWRPLSAPCLLRLIDGELPRQNATPRFSQRQGGRRTVHCFCRRRHCRWCCWSCGDGRPWPRPAAGTRCRGGRRRDRGAPARTHPEFASTPQACLPGACGNSTAHRGWGGRRRGSGNHSGGSRHRTNSGTVQRALSPPASRTPGAAVLLVESNVAAGAAGASVAQKGVSVVAGP